MKQLLSQFAMLVSVFFSPLLFVPLMFIAALIRSGLPGFTMVTISLIFFLIGIIPMIGTLVYFKKTGRISDWGISKREERYALSVVGLTCFLVVFLLLWSYRETPVGMVVEQFVIGSLLFAMITHFWKISAHAAVATLFFLFASYYFDLPWYWSVTAVVLVCWSRWYRKRHSLLQLIGGIILSWSIWVMSGVN
jgi:membrane-associated phospholipid phosphatase